MNVVAMIPARYAASRFPGKLMKTLGNKSVILHTHDNTVATGLFDEVWVVTDSDVIYNEITSHGGRAKMSIREHESGSDRIAEAVENMDVDVIINVQGDTPFVQKDALKQLIDLFKDETVQVASMMRPLREKELIENPNLVKVVVDKNMNSLLFSRSVIPYPRNTQINIVHHEHIGIYAFTKKALLNFTKWPLTPLEDAEKIECLRFLEHGISLRMTVVDYQGVGIDTPEDLKRAVQLL
ncbi:MAG: 3-deoxy-manno-octulosonate cytidylyltransferase [Agriterribacter sp.]